MSRPLLLGHRGARATRTIPENTLASFDLALEHGCDGFEFDVRQSADGQLVICHDPKFKDVLLATAGAGMLAGLATLPQVLARYQASAFLDIEIKVPDVETALLTALREHPPQRGFVVSSFLPEVLLNLRRLDPELPLGLICENDSQFAQWHRLPVQFVIPHYTLTNIDLTNQVQAANKRLLPWTVNSPEQMRRLTAMGVDGLISDHGDFR